MKESVKEEFRKWLDGKFVDFSFYENHFNTSVATRMMNQFVRMVENELNLKGFVFTVVSNATKETPSSIVELGVHCFSTKQVGTFSKVTFDQVKSKLSELERPQTWFEMMNDLQKDEVYVIQVSSQEETFDWILDHFSCEDFDIAQTSPNSIQISKKYDRQKEVNLFPIIITFMQLKDLFTKSIFGSKQDQSSVDKEVKMTLDTKHFINGKEVRLLNRIEEISSTIWVDDQDIKYLVDEDHIVQSIYDKRNASKVD